MDHQLLLTIIYRDIMPAKPKKSRRKTWHNRNKYSSGWVFLAQKETLSKPVSCRSLSTLSKLAESNTYITPAGFWHNRDRNKLTLRWLTSFVLDFDDILDPDIVLDRITRAGLPSPTFLNQTNTGIHAWWLFDKPLRVSSAKVVSLYDAIHRDMVRLAEADPHYTAASERFARIPKKIIYSSMNRYAFEEFKTWRQINVLDDPEIRTSIVPSTSDWLSSPGIKKLLKMDVSLGQRNCACYTLALAFKASNIAQEEALSQILDWNRRLSSPLSRKEVHKTVKSAYKERFKQPSRRHLAAIVGDIAFSNVRYLTRKKERSERQRWHLDEIADIIIEDLRKNKLVEESQESWARRLSIPLRSFKKVLSDLRAAGIVFGITGRGRYAVSYYKLSETFIRHGSAAILAACEKVNKYTNKASQDLAGLDSACTDDAIEAKDNTVCFKAVNNSYRPAFNSAYSYKHLVSGVVGGCVRLYFSVGLSWPGWLPGYLLRVLLRDFFRCRSPGTGHVVTVRYG